MYVNTFLSAQVRVKLSAGKMPGVAVLLSLTIYTYAGLGWAVNSK